MIEVEKEPPLVWQTILHCIAALVILIPAIYIFGFLVQILDFIQEGYIGRTGEGIGFFMRGIQCFLASMASLIIPSVLLKRSNFLIVSTIYGTIIGIFLLFVFAMYIFNPTLSSNTGFYSWLGLIASAIGLLAAPFMYKEFVD